ncbi:GNAT family N-acetyltransferase [Aestuariimicrobium kwangyangense]|uniref:GNAT family N-acetyltransferase n=1 Tax=Aestuariimicrobium kwangyangense TaxID=396389 RepID=UPI0003B40D79|nr:GNAT family N-acetyltransferase [Aestuariimicrobium kwangyangense]
MQNSYHVAMADLPPVEADGSSRDPGVLDGLLRAAVEVDNRAWREVFGHDDFTNIPEAYLQSLAQQQNARKRLLLALTGPVFASGQEAGLPLLQPHDDPGDAVVVGTCMIMQSRHDNLHLLDGFEVTVDPDHRRRGVGTMLVRAVETVARDWGVDTLISWGTHENGEGRDDALHPREGAFSIARDVPARFALRHGFSLAQCERHSVQRVHGTQVSVPHLPHGYELVQWINETPEELLEAKARLNLAMSTDVPKGELELEDEVWTADRVASSERDTYRNWMGLTTAARHVDSGELAGYTNIRRRPQLPAVAWQEVTIVLASHRGNGLGELMKAANLEWLRREWPRTERVHTWNAGENQWMLAINDRLGYQVASVGGAWQKKV